MPFLNFLFQPKNELESGGRSVAPVQSDASEPEKNCPNCHRDIPISTLWSNYNTCPCGYHFRMSARERLSLLCDEGSFCEIGESLRSTNSLDFPGYNQKLAKSAAESGEREGVVTGTATVGGYPCAVFAMEPRFMMGSMGSVIGEKLTMLFEQAAERGLPVIGYTVSGGARMQEGILSLMQMAKVSAAVKRHSDAGNLYVAILTDPTTGGVSASFAFLGDIILAEPKALIGFAGPRVIEQTIHQKLPENFQRAEFLLEKGFLDNIVERRKQKEYLTKLLRLHTRK